MDVTLISPNIVTQKGDFFGSGIPYMPFTLAYVAATLKEQKHKVTVIDAFGEEPTKVTVQKGHFIQGLTPKEVAEKIPEKTQYIILSAERVIGHNALILIIDEIKRKKELKNAKLCVIENSQAVSAYSLKVVYKEFFNCGVDYVIIGEPEERVPALLDALQKKTKQQQQKAITQINGIISKENETTSVKRVKEEKLEFIKELDKLPFPAWELFPLEKYWDLHYAHAPLTTKKYIPLLTSRGCPFPCGFCVVPATNQQRWRFRSPKNVVDEIEYLVNTFNVTEFHLEDLNPTIRKERIKEMCEEIEKRNLQIQFKIGSGTKIETIDEETIDKMAAAGCTFISFSPESGSPEVLKRMRKPFPHERALELTRHMHKRGIITQACFVLGYPQENEHDRLLTREYIKKLAKAGCDEIALFIMAPVPGASTYQEYKEKLEKQGTHVDLQDMSFSPKWREDYAFYKKFRTKAYLDFMITKLLHHPIKTCKQPINILLQRFNTKMEMTIYRVAKTYLLGIQRSLIKRRKEIILFWIITITIIYFIARGLDLAKYAGVL